MIDPLSFLAGLGVALVAVVPLVVWLWRGRRSARVARHVIYRCLTESNAGWLNAIRRAEESDAALAANHARITELLPLAELGRKRRANYDADNLRRKKRRATASVRLPDGTGLSSASPIEPVPVSPLCASIPSALRVE